MNHQDTKAPSPENSALSTEHSALSPDPARGPFIFNRLGRPLYLLDPRPEDIDPLDIAHNLAWQWRYNGCSPRGVSVAEHSLLVAEVVAREHPELALAALLHDAAEAYVGDIPAPLKRLLRLGGLGIFGEDLSEPISRLEGRWQNAINIRFKIEQPEMCCGLGPRQRAIIRAADLAVGAAEMLSFGWQVTDCPRVGHLTPADVKPRHFDPETAQGLFLAQLAILLGADKNESLSASLRPHEEARDSLAHLIEQALAQEAQN